MPHEDDDDVVVLSDDLQAMVDEYNDWAADRQFQISEILAGLNEDPINTLRIGVALNKLLIPGGVS